MRPRAPLTPGRLLYLFYHLPRAECVRTIRQGGPWAQWIDRRERAAMEEAAWSLPPPFFPNSGPPLELHLLTGSDFAFQSVFCLWSLAQAARRNLTPVFYDDDTLTPELIEKLRFIFPFARIVTSSEMTTPLENFLPAVQFPALRHRRRHQPHLRKLIDPHLGSIGWKLVVDSDLLFFRKPDFLLDWLTTPRLPLHMVDLADAYGYSRSLMEELARKPMPERLNVGLCGLRSESLDWEKLEWWCGKLLEAEGSHYLLEQALVALLLAGEECAVAPESDYVIHPSLEEASAPSTVMHHYVNDSKRGYFRHAWKHFVPEIQALPKKPVILSLSKDL